MRLVLPEGTHLKGTVVAARKARWFHRSGQLRFNFQEINLPVEVARVVKGEEETQANAPVATQHPAQEMLKTRTHKPPYKPRRARARCRSKSMAKVACRPKSPRRDSWLRPWQGAIARSAGDNDPIRNHNRQIIGQNPNVGGRTIGGGFGFGLLGVAISQSSRYVGTAFGYYGMAWSLYSTLIAARRAEVQFGKSAMVDIRFNTRSAPPPHKPESEK